MLEQPAYNIYNTLAINKQINRYERAYAEVIKPTPPPKQ